MRIGMLNIRVPEDRIASPLGRAEIVGVQLVRVSIIGKSMRFFV
jgi:hypothetical protein